MTDAATDLRSEESAVSTSVHDRTEAIAAAADEVVQRATPGVPGVVAGITDHERTLYLGASGVRSLGGRARR